MTDLDKRIDGLSPSKRALYELKLKRRGLIAPDQQSIPRRANRDVAPLSYAQQRLWFMEQMNPGSSSYNVPRAMRVSGRLNVNALQQAINEIVNRHEALRTSFVTVNGRPRQVIAPSMKVMLTLIDLRYLPHTEREEEAKRKADREAQQPFELDKAPLLRVALLRLGEQEQVLLLTMH